METWFINQVGPVWKFDSKGPVVRLMAKVLKDGEPNQRKAKWIDDLPALKPTKTDVPPVLPAKTLYYDASAVNAHWEVFQKRNPLIGAYFNKVGITPVMDSMPNENFESFADGWVSRNGLCFETDSQKYVQALGRGLLYVDFLASRGGEQGKKDAVRLLTWVSFALGIQFTTYVKDISLASSVANEMTWPLLDPVKGHWNEMLSRDASNAFKDAKMEKAMLNYEKWILLNVKCDDSYKNYLLLNRCNAYSRAKDDTGVIFMLHAVYSDGQYDKTLEWINSCFIRNYGKKEGASLYHLYLEAVYAEKKHPVVAKALGLSDSQKPAANETDSIKRP